MAKSNPLLARHEAEVRAAFRAGLETGRQQILDMVRMTLNDPNYMGKDTFGSKRQAVVVQGVRDNLEKYDPAFNCTDETDYYQELLDRNLGATFEEKKVIDPFCVRYPYCREYDYTKGKWKR